MNKPRLLTLNIFRFILYKHFPRFFLVPVTMVLERESTVSCASWREIPFNKFKFNLREQLRHTKFGNGETKAFGHRRGISSAHLCQSLRGQSCQSPKYCVRANTNRSSVRGKEMRLVITTEC